MPADFTHLALWIYHDITLLLANFLLKKSSAGLMRFSLHIIVLFCLVAFKIILWLYFVNIITICLGVDLLLLILFEGSLVLLDLDMYLHPQIEKFFYLLFLQMNFLLHLLFSSRTAIIWMLLHFLESLNSLTLFLFCIIVFSLFCSSWFTLHYSVFSITNFSSVSSSLCYFVYWAPYLCHVFYSFFLSPESVLMIIALRSPSVMLLFFFT